MSCYDSEALCNRSPLLRPHIVTITGAGISAESGLKTFRDSDGLWEGYNVQEVATPEAWERNPLLVQRFYNERRKSVRRAKPNPGHFALAELELSVRVSVITQNIDDLHERAGSTSVTHLHGEILYSRSSVDPDLVYPVQGDDIEMGEKCEKGSQLRPHIVWFGEAVPKMEEGISLCSTADILLIVGTSLVVYPAASLVQYVPKECPIFIVDPVIPEQFFQHSSRVRWVPEKASVGVPLAIEMILSELGRE